MVRKCPENYHPDENIQFFDIGNNIANELKLVLVDLFHKQNLTGIYADKFCQELSVNQRNSGKKLGTKIRERERT